MAGCAKCIDPLEGDTFGSCFRCLHCGAGWQLPHSGKWCCTVCGFEVPLAEVREWDDQMRQMLEHCLDLPPEQMAPRLRAFITEALRRCHPNHALLLQARLALVSLAMPANEACDEDNESPWCEKLIAADKALALSVRIGPSRDFQRGDLLFQKGLAHHSLAQHALHVAQQQGMRTRPTAAATHLRAAADAMLRAAAEFRATCSEGAEARPYIAASKFASLVVQQIRKQTSRN